MTISEIDHILAKGEGIHIEFKEAGTGIPASLYETVVSFSNREGGSNTIGTKLHELDWPDKQPVRKEEIEKIPSWDQKSTMLLHKKSWYLLSILLLSLEPVKLENLMKWMGYSNRNTFRKNYLHPLQKVGWISMTHPENPQDPNQKYITTHGGRLFLSGKNL